MPDARLRVRVAEKDREALDICSLKLIAADAEALPAFSAGSHIDLHLPNGLTRQYSLCNGPTDWQCYVIGVLREPNSRGGSAAVHESVRPGDVLEIGVPRNHFPIAANAAHSVLLAGGIGITPIICMAELLSEARASFEMHYCTRSRERTAFHERIRMSGYSDRMHFHFDDGPDNQRLQLEALAANGAPGTHLYVCGPKGFMDAVLRSAERAGWPGDSVHYEFFSADPVATGSDTGFYVKLASSGKLIYIPPNTSVVDALDQAGIIIPTSCQQGICGTCLTRVLDGVPDHRDFYLTDEEHACNDQFTPCCSRAKTNVLVLDV